MWPQADHDARNRILAQLVLPAWSRVNRTRSAMRNEVFFPVSHFGQRNGSRASYPSAPYLTIQRRVSNLRATPGQSVITLQLTGRRSPQRSLGFIRGYRSAMLLA